MAADPTTARQPVLAEDSAAFENEIPTYRAYSPLALFSAGCGLLAGLSFVSYYWEIAAILAVAAGVLADWRIRKLPDLLTGRKFAHAGIAMGLAFGLFALGYDQWAAYRLRSDSTAFAREFTKALNAAKVKNPPDTSDVMWFMLYPEMRKGISPEEAKKKISELKEGSVKVATIEIQIRQMAKFAGEANPIEVVGVEDSFYDGNDAYATVLLKVGNGENHFHDHEEEEKAARAQSGRAVEAIIGEGPENAVLVVHGIPSGREYRYYVDQVRYPYVPKSYKAVPEKPKDDGHGHDH